MPYYYAPCALGLEPLLAEEVKGIGGHSLRVEKGGVAFSSRKPRGMALCLGSGVARRVWAELWRGRVRGADDLYRLAQQVDWSKQIRTDQTLAVHASLRTPHLNHSGFAAQKVKDAVVDQLRSATGERPSVDTDDPDLPLKLVIRGEYATLARDLAGDSLHKRGWRPIQVKSPMNEALAAGLLQLAQWDCRSALVDPMCGSGTLLIEAAHLAGDRAPGLERSFAFERWLAFDHRSWARLKKEAMARWEAGREAIPHLQGNDRHAGAIEIATAAARRAGVLEHISFSVCDIAEFVPAPAAEMVVCNPPFGVRIGEGDDLDRSWRELGRFLKSRCRGATAWVLSGDPELTKGLRLKTSRRIPVRSGALDCRWLRYEIRAGTPGDREPKPQWWDAPGEGS